MADEQLFPDGEVRWRISAAWATKNHDCTPHGIQARCHGRCCFSKTFWPAAAFKNPSGVCGYLGPEGCTHSADDKPVACHLYPLMLKHGMLQQYFRNTCGPHGLCRGNHGQGPMLIDAIRDSLVHLFGQEQYDRVRADVLAGRDGWFDVPPDVARAAALELEDAEAMRITPPRSQR